DRAKEKISLVGFQEVSPSQHRKLANQPQCRRQDKADRRCRKGITCTARSTARQGDRDYQQDQTKLRKLETILISQL
ncbi:hypothetical protein RCCGE510_28551, partial (plasmid) [Rhizobium sp. CCGE 510]